MLKAQSIPFVGKADIEYMFANLPSSRQPMEDTIGYGLVFHFRKSVSCPDSLHIFVENDLGIHYLGLVKDNDLTIATEIVIFEDLLVRKN